MRKLIIIAMLLTGMAGHAQGKIYGNIAQDFKLAFFEDGKGNKPYTPDLIFRMELQGKMRQTGYTVIYAEFEIAELGLGTYKRYHYGVGQTYFLDKLFSAGLLENFKGTTTIGYGFIDYNGAMFSFDATFQLAYKINDWFEVFTQWQLAERKDLARYGESIRGSGAVGLKILVFTTKSR